MVVVVSGVATIAVPGGTGVTTAVPGGGGGGGTVRVVLE